MRPLLKMQATGNDFLILDLANIAGQVDERPTKDVTDRPAFARRVCDRHFGFGADGFIVLEKKQDELRWDFYNSDGSFARLCGNATRAVGTLVLGAKLEKFNTAVGPVWVRPHELGVEVSWTLPMPKPVGKKGYALIDTGVPHAVLKVESLTDQKILREIGRKIKSEHTETGMNVTFLVEKSAGQIESVTFERGVEDFTLSCGTGAIAAALVHGTTPGQSCEVLVPGGRLRVQFAENKCYLAGPAGRIGWCLDLGEEE